MATVRLSESLKSEILKNARDGYAKRIRKLKEDNPRPESWGQRIYDTLVPQELKNKLNQVPSDWFQNTVGVSMEGWQSGDSSEVKQAIVDSLTVTRDEQLGDYPYDVEDNDYFYNHLKWDIASQVRPVKGENSGLIGGGYDYKIDIDDSRFAWLRKEYAEWIKPFKELLNERKVYMDNVKALLESHKTLAPMLKKWDGLWELVPETTKTRHKEVYERPTPEQLDDKTKDIDFDSLTATTTINKLME